MTPIDSLIGKLEQATGPDRGLDADIACAFGFSPKVSPVYRRGYYPKQKIRDKETWPAFTASLDSALTLVPAGARLLELGQWSDNGKPDGWFCQVARWIKTGEHSWTETGFAYGVPESGATTKPKLAPSPAIALCIAALKARTSMESNHD